MYLVSLEAKLALAMIDIGASLAALRIAVDALKGASSALNKGEIQKAIIDVQSALMDAQSTALQLQSEAATYQRRISDLEKEISEADEWAKRASCYKLFEFLGGTNNWVRLFDPVKGKAVGLDEPSHFACTSCFNKREISILLPVQGNEFFAQCPICKTRVQTRPSPQMGPNVIFNFPPQEPGLI